MGYNSFPLGAAIFGAASIFALPAISATYTADDLIRQYNVITFGDLKLHDEVEGRVYVGGNLTVGNATQLMFDKPANQSGFNDESVIVGSVTGSNLNVQGGSNITVGGSVTNSVLELNGHGTARIGQTLTATANQGTKLTQQWTNDPNFADRFPQDVEATFTAASIGLANLAGVNATKTGNVLSFSAAPTTGVTVYDISFTDLLGVAELKFDLNGANTVIINVSGTSGSWANNFITGDTGFEDLADHLVWNFHEALDITLNRQVWGTLIAPTANITGSNTNYEGTIVAKSLTTFGEMHSQGWSGKTTFDLPPTAPPAVPVPAALPLLGAGLGALALFRRRARG